MRIVLTRPRTSANAYPPSSSANPPIRSAACMLYNAAKNLSCDERNEIPGFGEHDGFTTNWTILCLIYDVSVEVI